MQIPVRIVLVETSHPGNIGASARAMKTMGLSELALVRPRTFPSEEATARASGAADLLERARLYPSLAEAVADCAVVVGASARSRSVEWPTLDPRRCAERLRGNARAGHRTAIVLGPEQSGLTNEDLARCGLLVQIPTDRNFASLNLAMAVQVLCYELRMAWTGSDDAASAAAAIPGSTVGQGAAPPATAADLESLQAHVERVLTEAGFLRTDHPRQLKLKLRRIVHRAALDRNEIAILRGALTALEPARRRAGRSR